MVVASTCGEDAKMRWIERYWELGNGVSTRLMFRACYLLGLGSMRGSWSTTTFYSCSLLPGSVFFSARLNIVSRPTSCCDRCVVTDDVGYDCSYGRHGFKVDTCVTVTVTVCIYGGSSHLRNVGTLVRLAQCTPDGAKQSPLKRSSSNSNVLNKRYPMRPASAMMTVSRKKRIESGFRSELSIMARWHCDYWTVLCAIYNFLQLRTPLHTNLFIHQSNILSTKSSALSTSNTWY